MQDPTENYDEALMDVLLDRLERKVQTRNLLAQSDERIRQSRDVIGIPADEPIPSMCDWEAVRMGDR